MLAILTVIIPMGTSNPGCELLDECYEPSFIDMSIGGEITWSNEDAFAHTVTSGTASSGPDGKFDSSLMMPGNQFEMTFDEEGRFPYFCMVHPWMVGQINVVDSEQSVAESLPVTRDLAAENAELRKQVIELSNEVATLKDRIDGLNAIILSQLQVIYDWVVAK